MCILGLEICQFLGDMAGILQLDYIRCHSEENFVSMPFNLNAATVLFGIVVNSLPLNCSEKPALTVIVVAAKISSECINMNKHFFKI